jgi:type VI secretion system secreted protein VgrG
MPRVMEVTTPLGGDVLLFHGMQGREELSRPSEYQIDLLSTKSDIDVDKILGKNVTVKLALPDDSIRHFNGYVTRFTQHGSYGRYHRYVAVVRTWLWFLTRTTDCRIFQEMTVQQILEKVFADHPDIADVKFELTGSYRTWTYCVQYRESDFNFVSRLMEHEGMYYYFRHTEGHNTLVITDSTSKHTPTEGYEKISFIEPERVVRPELEHISSWDFSREVQPGAFVHNDYDFERPSVKLKTQKVVSRSYALSGYEVFDSPGYYVQKPDGDQYAAVRIDEYASQFETAHAATNARGVTVGSLFTLEDCPREDQNVEHLIVAANHELQYSDYEGIPFSEGAACRCGFVAMATKQQFRPRRVTPKPFVQGPQTAVVVGPGGDEIYTDQYGRVKVQFHWDRLGEKNEKSSCWVRVSQPWAGKMWGGVTIPRIGQEVIVDFLEGDPDQPIITGRVYNAEQMPPYALPANKTQSGLKSRSSMDGGVDNFNEIRFEDLKGSEQVFIHAEKNQDIEVENDETHWVGHDRTKTIDHDETTHVKHDRTETVDNNETITVHANRTETVDKDEAITISGNRSEGVRKNESINIDGNRTVTVGGVESISIAKNQSVSVKGDQGTTIDKKQTVSVGDSLSLTVTNNESSSIGKNRQAQIGENDSIKAGKTLQLAAGDQITIQTGSASITMKKDGTITIKGKDITLDGSGKINVKAGGDVIVKGSKVMQN